MPKLEADYVMAFVTLVLPGLLAMQTYRLRVPSENHNAKDRLIEIVTFSLLNLAIVGPVVSMYAQGPLTTLTAGQLWFAGVLALVLAPVVLGLLAAFGREFLDSKSLAVGRYKTAFDSVFGLRAGCWLIVELDDGRIVGGRFGTNSYATTYPESGDLYIEELWTVSDDGRYFVAPSPGNPGIVLKSGEYKFIKVFFGMENAETANA